LQAACADQIAAQCARSGVRVGVLDARTLRCVTHLDVTEADVRTAARVLAEARALVRDGR
jgi:threonine aldolase